MPGQSPQWPKCYLVKSLWWNLFFKNIQRFFLPLLFFASRFFWTPSLYLELGARGPMMITKSNAHIKLPSNITCTRNKWRSWRMTEDGQRTWKFTNTLCGARTVGNMPFKIALLFFESKWSTRRSFGLFK